jgi:hypothetical protein
MRRGRSQADSKEYAGPVAAANCAASGVRRMSDLRLGGSPGAGYTRRRCYGGSCWPVDDCYGYDGGMRKRLYANASEKQAAWRRRKRERETRSLQEQLQVPAPEPVRVDLLVEVRTLAAQVDRGCGRLRMDAKRWLLGAVDASRAHEMIRHIRFGAGPAAWRIRRRCGEDRTFNVLDRQR